MRPIVRTLLLPAIVATTLLAQTASQAAGKPPANADVPPPPGMNDPGVATSPPTPAATQDPPADAAPANDDPLAPLPKPDARLARDKASREVSANSQRIAGSDVTRRKQGEDTIEEYREHGHLWMIKIVPINGPIQWDPLESTCRHASLSIL